MNSTLSSIIKVLFLSPSSASSWISSALRLTWQGLGRIIGGNRPEDKHREKQEQKKLIKSFSVTGYRSVICVGRTWG